jgi:putative glutamine amidotransferase
LATAAPALWFNLSRTRPAARLGLSRILNVAERKPLIGIPADRRILGPHPFHCVGEKYIRAVADAADAVPVLIPALGDELDFDAVLASIDGILLTGSPSNVEPHRYAGTESDAGTMHDPHRDATTLPLIPRVVESGMPLFAVCRGFQEMNVAYGGTLSQKVQDLSGVDRVMVNSLHSQGIDRLGADLEVEARAPDGLVEGFSVRSAPGFALAVQWHPEWQVMMNPFSRALFAAFGQAARAHAKGNRS